MSDLATGPLFEQLQMGAWALPNRVIMAPLTRSRSKQPGDIPWELNAEYYAQRASAGLIISEATQVSPQGKGYAFTPGIHTAAQVAGWRLVTDAVHARGGRIVLQLWHVGRISHVDLQPDGAQPVAPSAIRAEAMTYLNATSGRVPVSEPRALELDEIPGVVEQFRHGARLAREAGFDGVEIHGANGYLLDQFMRDGINLRTDAYGGPLAHRLRFPLEVTDAVVEVWGADRVGYRISPNGEAGALNDSDPEATFAGLAAALSERGLAYLHGVEAFRQPHRCESILARVRAAFDGVYMANGSYDAQAAHARIVSGKADCVSFGVPFIANPDLVERFRQGATLNEADAETFYGGDARGYTDYPSLDSSVA